jgi:inosose dehydratase
MNSVEVGVVTSGPNGVQVGFNPLTWYFTENGYDPSAAPPLPEIYRQIRDAGFDAVHVEIPAGMSVRDYRRLLDDTGLAPAPGYFQAPFSDPDARSAAVESARRVAGEHAALGLSRIFVAEQFGAAERVQQPAQGAGFQPDRLSRIVESLTDTAAAMVAEGVTPCLHQHVGTWIETEAETVAILDRIDPALLLVGPDTGHLAWAGADPARFIQRYPDRIGAVHLKDIRAAVRERPNDDYMTAVAQHIWTEPGRGDVDFAAVLDVLAGFTGWFVVEVDLADQPTPKETAAVSAEWVKQHLSTGPAA